MKSFKYLGSILTNDGRCTCEIKFRIAMAKAAFNKKKAVFTSTLDLELSKKLVKCYIWSTALYGAETVYRDRRFATLQRTLFIYLINKYISLSDICLTVHH